MSQLENSNRHSSVWMTLAPGDGGDEWRIVEVGQGLFEARDPHRSLQIGSWADVCDAAKQRCLVAAGDGAFWLTAERDVPADMTREVLGAGEDSGALLAGSELKVLILPHPSDGRPVVLHAGPADGDLDEFTPVGRVLLKYSWFDDDFLGTSIGHLLVDVGDGLAVSWPRGEAAGWDQPRVLVLDAPGDARAAVIENWCVEKVSQGTGVLSSEIMSFDPSRQLSAVEAAAWADLLDDSRWHLSVDVDGVTLTSLRRRAAQSLVCRAFTDPASTAGLRLKELLAESSIYDLDIAGALAREEEHP